MTSIRQVYCSISIQKKALTTQRYCCIIPMYPNLHGISYTRNKKISKMAKLSFLSFWLTPSHFCESLFMYTAVLRIHAILVWIRIRGSKPLTNGSRSGSWIWILLFSSLTLRCQQKTNLIKNFCLLLFECTFTSFLKDIKSKSHKNSRNQGFSYYFCIMIEGIRIRIWEAQKMSIRIRIRIRNTGIQAKHQPYHTENKNNKREGREVAGIAVIGEPSNQSVVFFTYSCSLK